MWRVGLGRICPISRVYYVHSPEERSVLRSVNGCGALTFTRCSDQSEALKLHWGECFQVHTLSKHPYQPLDLPFLMAFPYINCTRACFPGDETNVDSFASVATAASTALLYQNPWFRRLNLLSKALDAGLALLSSPPVWRAVCVSYGCQSFWILIKSFLFH